MNFNLKPFLLFLFFFTSFSDFSQDSIFHWKVSSKKIGEGNYELSFSTQGSTGWQLYSTSQSIADLVTELKFDDSSITVQKKFTEIGEAKKINSFAFDNATATVYEGPVEWKTTIRISGAIPSQ